MLLKHGKIMFRLREYKCERRVHYLLQKFKKLTCTINLVLFYILGCENHIPTLLCTAFTTKKGYRNYLIKYTYKNMPINVVVT